MSTWEEIKFDSKRREVMESLRSEPYVIKDMFSSKDIDTIKQLEQEYRQVDKHRNVKNTQYKDNDEIVHFLQERLVPYIGEYVRHGGNYFRTSFPFCVHTDTGKYPALKEDMIPYKNVVIPLIETSKNAPCKTVIFHQRHYGEASHFLRGPLLREGTPDWNHKIVDYEHLENYTNNPFNAKDYIDFLTHLPYNNLYGLSMSHVFDWNVGSAMIFDSSLLHSSNDFFPDTAEKHALNIFTAKQL